VKKDTEAGVEQAATGPNVKKSGSKAASTFGQGFQSKVKSAPEFAKAGDEAGKTFGAKFGGAVGNITKRLALGGLIGGAALGIASAKMATDFQSAMTKIQTQAGASRSDVKLLSKEILGLGGKVQQTPLELANAMYHLKSVGLDNVKAMQALRAASNLAAVGGANLEETTNAVAGAWRSGIKGAANFGQAAATVNAIIGAGNMRMQDFIDAIGTGFLPSARSFGVSLSSIGSALALMTDEGIPANVAATRLRMTLSLLAAPSGKAADALSQIGLGSNALANAMRSPRGIVSAVGLLKQHLDASGLSATKQAQLLSHAFGGGRSSSAILTLLNNYDVLVRKQDQINHSMGKFGPAVKAQTQTAQAQFALLRSTLDTVMVEIGTKLIPVITKLVSWILKAHLVIPILIGVVVVLTTATIAWGAAMIVANFELFAVVAAIAAVVVAAIFLATHWKTIWHGVLVAVRVVWDWIKANWPLLAVILLGPIGLVVVAVVKNFHTIEGAALALYHFLLPVFRVIGKVGAAAWLVISTAAKIAWDLIYGLVLLNAFLIRGIMKALGIAAEFVFVHVIQPAAKAVWSAVTTYVRVMWSIVHPILNVFETVAKAVWGAIKDSAKRVWDQITGIVKTALGIGKTIIKIFLGVVLTVFGAIIDGAAKAFGWVPGLGPKLRDAANKFDQFRDHVNAALGAVRDRHVAFKVSFSGANSVGSTNHPIGQLATGGEVRGPGGPRDDTAGLFRLSDREWVVQASSAAKYGGAAMSAVNQGTAKITYPGLAGGGSVGGFRQDGTQVDVRPQLPSNQQIVGTFEANIVRLAKAWAATLGGSGAAIVRDAMRWIGRIPYVWGGTSVPGGADCSGFVQTIYGRHGISAPRTSEAQGGWVRRSGPVPGGLAFYNSPAGGPPPGHVAIIGEGGKVISQGGGMGPQYIPLHALPLMFTGIPPHGFPGGGGGGSGGRRGLGQLESLWEGAGGPGGMTAHIAAAIALAESGGNAGARNPSGASGLWQILGQVVPGNIFNPLVNAENAVTKWRDARGFGPWVTYVDGAYRKFMTNGGTLGEDVVGVGASGRQYQLHAGEEVTPVTTVERQIALLAGIDRKLGRLLDSSERAPAGFADALTRGAHAAVHGS
jgi:TP901 family phage tail tape measure protein